jgi:staphylococcal nuclease domain-containing protein 1
MTPPRENGLVYLSGTNVLETAVSEGWVKLRESGRKDKSEEEETILAKLKDLEDKAKSSGKGMWSSENGKVDVKHDISGHEKQLLEQWKGKDIDGIYFDDVDLAIIEATPAADRIRARLLIPDAPQQIIPIVLAGVRSPSASKKNANDEVPDSTGQAEEFGDEARWFVESKLLQRNVKVEIMYLLIPVSS